jgi:dihydrolipoamide dehydrogenase
MVEVVIGYKIDGRAQISKKTFRLLKLVVERETAQIIGVHLFTKGASNMAGEASLIVSMKATLRDVAEAIHPHPTLTESFGFLARNMLSKIGISPRG